MQSWQFISFGLVAVIFIYAFKMRGKLGAKAAEMHSGSMQALRTEVASGRPPDEGDPICFQAIERKMLSAKIFYVALTNRRLMINLAGGQTRSFDRRTVQMGMRAKTFADVGNMQTTYSRGWELKLVLPDSTKHTWRVYEQADGLSDHSSHVQALVTTLSAH